MIIREWDDDYLIATDNFITNLPISRLSSIPVAAHGLGPDDLMLVSKPCDPAEMTETGYMSYQARLDDLSTWTQDALGITGITADVLSVRQDVDQLTPYLDLLQRLSSNSQSALVDVEDENGRFNPLQISAIYVKNGTILTSLGGYRMDMALDAVLAWNKIGSVAAGSGVFDGVSAGPITAGPITAGPITAGPVTADSLSAGVVNTDTMNANAVHAASVYAAGEVRADEIEAEDGVF